MRMFLKGNVIVTQIQHTSHDGMDIKALEDLNVYSNLNGVVDYAGWENVNDRLQGFGLYLRIKKFR